MIKIAALYIVLIFTGCATTKSLPEKTELAELHLQIGTDYLKKESYPLALKELLIAEDLNPNNAMIQANLGLVYFMRERYELSEKHYRKAISLNPKFTDAKNNLSRAFIEIGQYRQAEILLKDVLADLTYIDFPKAYANYGVLEFKRNNYASATEYFKKSLERDRENCYTHVYYGRSYLELKDTNYAVILLEKAIPFCNQIEVDEALFYSAIALYRNNQKDKARLRFEELIRLYPAGYNNEKSQKMLALLKKGTL